MSPHAPEPADDDEDDEIDSPEEILAMLRSEEPALARIVNSAGPETRRIAAFLEGTMFPLLSKTLMAMAVHDAAIDELESSVYGRSTIQPEDAAKIHLLLDKTLSLFESAKEMLPIAERDAFGGLIGEVRRLVIRAESDDDESEGDDDDAADNGIATAPEIPRASDSP